MIITPYPKNAKKQFTCKCCGVEWSDYRSNDKNKQFCSIKCKSDYSRIERVCMHCSNKFSICKSVLKTNASGHYCSTDCYHSSMRVGVMKHKNGFRGIVRKHFPKPQQCAKCGIKDRIHIHHIVPFRYTQNNDLSNLIPLCISCHKSVEIYTEQVLKVDTDYARVFDLMSNM